MMKRLNAVERTIYGATFARALADGLKDPPADALLPGNGGGAWGAWEAARAAEAATAAGFAVEHFRSASKTLRSGWSGTSVYALYLAARR